VIEHERCTACDFDGGRFENDALLGAMRDLGTRWRALLSTAGTELGRRPEPEVWSAIEYAAHSRDITALHAFGIEQALTVDEPRYPPIADDLISSAAADYAGADPVAVVDELERQAGRIAHLVSETGPAGWTRGLTIGDERTEVRRLIEHALHDSVHHLDDVERGLVRLRSTPPSEH
jgi:hypothetical protein